jgi:hypothetical protein
VEPSVSLHIKAWFPFQHQLILKRPCNDKNIIWRLAGRVMKNWIPYLWRGIYCPIHNLVHNATISEVFLLLCRNSQILSPPPLHRALSSALSGPDSAALRRTVWFCRRVWLCDCKSYLNRKEIIIPLGAWIYAGGWYCVLYLRGTDSELAKHRSKTENSINFFCLIKEHVEPCCVVLCRTMQGQKNMRKKTRKTCSGQSALGCV